MPQTPHPPPDPSVQCVQHRLAIQDHGSRLGHVEERVEVHDRTIFGFNGKEPGLVARVKGIEDAGMEYRKIRAMVVCALLAGVLEGGIAIGIAAMK